MDIKKKLDFYRSSEKPKIEPEFSSSLLALQDFFEGEICAPSAPYLKIIREHLFPFPRQIDLTLLTKTSISKPVKLDQCLFFDLETTGLAGGAGTFPFLLGFGYFTETAFKVEQFFLPDFGREYYLFQHLQVLFSRFPYLVSFNGKSYDLPLLKNRFILNRFQTDWEKFKHIDLLHLARRIWKDSYPRLELTSIERNILNRNRKDDIPGAHIPEAYFTFLRTGVIHNMKKIIEHNYLDIISLAELIVLMDEIEREPLTVNDERALNRLAKLAYDTNNIQKFDTIVSILSNSKNGIPVKINFIKSLIAKRAGNWQLAVEMWQELLNTKEYLFIALEELAKYYEHQKKDYKLAFDYTDRALSNLLQLNELNPYNFQAEVFQAFNKRKLRLKSKLTVL